MDIDDFRKMYPSALPKKKWFEPDKSPTMKAEMPEDAIQDYANDAIALRGWGYIRFHNSLLGWMKQHAPMWAKKCFFNQVAGKMPDNTIMVQVADGVFLAVKLELKTQDKKGRAVGRLHGKQKMYANREKWFIARSPEQVNSILDKVDLMVSQTKIALQKNNA